MNLDRICSHVPARFDLQRIRVYEHRYPNSGSLQRQSDLCQNFFLTHNVETALAVIAVSALCGVPAGSMGSALRTVRPIEHRLTLVRERRGVRWYNDSKGTNVGATVRSIESFTDPIILIAGGRDKASDLTPLRPLVRDRVKTLILIGESRARFRSAFAGLADCVEAESMAEAVRAADDRGRPGDVVLLSPACASFDMFADYEDRGRRFAAEVENRTP